VIYYLSYSVFLRKKIVANIAIICGYGLVGNNYRSKTEMKGLKKYYETITWKVRELCDTIIFTGGHTNSNHPDYSEAETAKMYWINEFDQPNQIIRTETMSTTSEGNIYFALLQLISGEITVEYHDFKPLHDILHIFCDEPRYWKMHVICWFFLKSNKIQYKIHRCNRIDINFRSNPLFQIFVGISKMLLKSSFWRKNNLIKINL
jgi:hypothetical protein